jgi:uncharacterized protein (TIGR00369 family)
MSSFPPDIAAQVARLAIPECAKTLGIEIHGYDASRREVTITAQGRNEFRNPMGAIQGGFLCAMLDDAMALAAVFTSGFQIVVPTLEMKVTFFSPAQPGTIHGLGRVARLGKTIAFLEGELTNDAGEVLAKASATARVAPMPGRG